MTNEMQQKIYELFNKGISYRKIGATLGIAPNTVKAVVTKTDCNDRTRCKECGKIIFYTPQRKKKKFCCDACRAAWWSKHREARNLKATYNYVCPNCGKIFTAYGNPYRVYCSRACSAMGRKERYGKGNV